MYLDVLKKMKQNLKLMKLKEKWEGKCHNHIPLDYLTSKVDQSDSQNRRGHCWSWCSLVRAKSLSHIRLFVTPWTVAHQAPLSMGFSRQEYWSGLPCPPPGNLLDPETEPMSPALQEDSLPLSHQGSPNFCSNFMYFLSYFKGFLSLEQIA